MAFPGPAEPRSAACSPATAHRVLPNGDVTCRHLQRCIAIKAMMHNRRKIYSSSRHSPACVSFHGFAAHTASTGVS